MVAQISQPNTPAPSITEIEIKEAKQEFTGAHIFLKCLIEEGVETFFGMPGGVILSIYEALQDYPSLKHVLVRHEQGAGHMAEGYARSTGKVGVMIATSGPGATNLVTALADAYYDSIPVVAFTGNVPTSLLANDSFQEADIVGITRPITKHNIMVRNVDDMAQAIKEAFHVAKSGRPGPVLVDIPKDILLAKGVFDYAAAEIDLPGYDTESYFTDSDIETALELIKNAKQPMLLVGGGVVNAGAHEQAVAFAERFNMPVGCSLMGLGGFPTDHPNYIGFTGMHGFYWANIAVANADVLVIAGNRLGERQIGKPDRFARNAKIIHIDLDPSSLQKNIEAMVPVQGDLKKVFEAFMAKSENTMSEHQASMDCRADWFATIDSWKTRRKTQDECGGFLTPQYAISRLFHFMPKDGFVTTEVGQHQMWAAQRFNLTRPRSFITSGGLGTMGFGFPAAIGVQAAFPDKIVLDIAGDGSFQMTLQELATARDNNLPVKIAIINNGFLGMVRQWQDKTWNRDSHSRMTSPDYIKLAEAYGGKGFVVEKPEDVDRVIQEAYSIMDRPVIIDFRVQERADVYPWVPAGGANEDMLTDPNAESK